jgi:transposase-like protein
MRGRHPAGPNYVDKLAASVVAKDRLKEVLETMVGEGRVQEACQRLGVCEQRFHQLRQEAMEGALTALEPGVPGRPTQTVSPEQERIGALEEEVAALKVELRAAKAREEIALALPRVVKTTDESEPEKKTRGRPKKRPPRRPPGMRKNT